MDPVRIALSGLYPSALGAQPPAISLAARICRGGYKRLNAALFLPGPVQWRLSTTERKRLHASAYTCGLVGGYGGWWFWLRKHRQLASYQGRMLSGLAWSSRSADEAARVSLPVPTLRPLRRRQQQQSI